MPRLPLSTLIRQSLVSNPKYGLNEIKNTSSTRVRPEDTLTNTWLSILSGENLAYRGKGRGAIRHSRRYLMGDRSRLFVRTATYKEVGGLDAGFFAHQEEVDMCWRLRSRGYRLVCVPQSIVYHVGGATLNAESPRKTFLNFRNSLLMLYKNSREADLKHVMQHSLFGWTISPPLSF